MKALEYKTYFIHIDSEQIACEEFRRYPNFFLDMKYRMFGQAVSKYIIVLVCVSVLTAFDAPAGLQWCFSF